MKTCVNRAWSGVLDARSLLVQWQHKFCFVCSLPMGPVCDTVYWEEGGQGLLKKTTLGVACGRFQE